MSSPGTLVYKIAETEAEFEQIHRLNYQTFVEEIPQHAPSPERRLVDKFHAENTYLIALVDGELAGMLAVRDRRPFSLDQKLPDLDAHLPPGRLICGSSGAVASSRASWSSCAWSDSRSTTISRSSRGPRGS
jgi:N-acyl-L-homoserine lactone synthetase